MFSLLVGEEEGEVVFTQISGKTGVYPPKTRGFSSLKRRNL